MFSLIILAAGQGKRMKLNYNKILHLIEDKTILEKSLYAFSNIILIKQVIIVVNKNDYQQIRKIIPNDIEITIGGDERYHSVYQGLEKVNQDYVLIHDAARCFIEKKDIQNLIDATLLHDACFLGVKSKDTIHIVEDGKINTPNRSHVYLAQTPQAFKTNIIKDAYQKMFASKNYQHVSDDVMVVSTYSDIIPKVVEGSYSNIKITTPEDLL